MRSGRVLTVAAGTAGLLALSACGGPPSPEAIAAEFTTPVEPVWETEVPGLFGELTVRDGVVLA